MAKTITLVGGAGYHAFGKQFEQWKPQTVEADAESDYLLGLTQEDAAANEWPVFMEGEIARPEEIKPNQHPAAAVEAAAKSAAKEAGAAKAENGDKAKRAK